MSIKPGIYLHYKGKRYEVLDTALHTETEEIMVLYRREGEEVLFVRPLGMFTEDVTPGVPRFHLVNAE